MDFIHIRNYWVVYAPNTTMTGDASASRTATSPTMTPESLFRGVLFVFSCCFLTTSCTVFRNQILTDHLILTKAASPKVAISSQHVNDATDPNLTYKITVTDNVTGHQLASLRIFNGNTSVLDGFSNDPKWKAQIMKRHMNRVTTNDIPCGLFVPLPRGSVVVFGAALDDAVTVGDLNECFQYIRDLISIGMIMAPVKELFQAGNDARCDRMIISLTQIIDHSGSSVIKVTPKGPQTPRAKTNRPILPRLGQGVIPCRIDETANLRQRARPVSSQSNAIPSPRERTPLELIVQNYKFSNYLDSLERSSTSQSSESHRSPTTPDPRRMFMIDNLLSRVRVDKIVTKEDVAPEIEKGKIPIASLLND